MDLLTELESLASHAELQDTRSSDAVSDADISRWQMLFGLSRQGAFAEIKRFREASDRSPIGSDLWELQQEALEAKGHDWETYEYQLYLAVQKAQRPSYISALTCSKQLETSAAEEYIFRFSGALQDIDNLEAILGHCPDIKAGITDDGRRASFCRVDAAGKDAIEHWLTATDSIQWPTFIRLSRARKELSSTCIHPTLGKESTLPQHRLDSLNVPPMPAQDQYPVTYFFYGTLTDPTILSRQTGVSMYRVRNRGLRPASIQGGKLRTWGSKYKALVDASDDYAVQGFAFEIQTSDQEDELRCYETAHYEIVRCTIRLENEGDIVKGLTFRFLDAEMLDDEQG